MLEMCTLNFVVHVKEAPVVEYNKRALGWAKLHVKFFIFYRRKLSTTHLKITGSNPTAS